MVSAVLYRRFGVISLAIIFLYGVFYLYHAYTPSSYGIVLETLGIPNTDKVGESRSIRSDEWAVITPFTQIVVANNGERYNTISPYKEDLRSFYALPLKDWGAIFKPTLAGFYFLDPAYAYSLHYYLLIVLFLSGYYLVFKSFGLDKISSALFSIILYNTGFVQFFWTTLGPTLSWFPWVYLVIISQTNLYVKSGLFFYSSMCLLLSFFYPPILPTLAVCALLSAFLFSPGIFYQPKTLLVLGCSAALALGVTLLYMWPAVKPMMEAVYPGKRSFGGGEVPFFVWLSQFFPTSQLYDGLALVAHKEGIQPNNDGFFSNVCEIGVVGSYLFLALMIFGRWKEYFTAISRKELYQILITFFILTLITIWMFVPIPSYFAKFIGLDQIRPRRWYFASGYILILLSIFILQRLRISLHPIRFALFSLIVVGAWYGFKHYQYNIGLKDSWQDIFILLPLLCLVMAKYFAPIVSHKAFLIGAVALSNIVSFIFFNPLQSAKPIFHPMPTAALQGMANKDAFNERGWLIVSTLPGAVAAGLGLPSIPHVLLKPDLAFFRPFFAELPEEEFLQVFSRYAHISVRNIEKPYVQFSDAIVVPASAFYSPVTKRKVQVMDKFYKNEAEKGGNIDRIMVDGDTLIITGWVPWEGIKDGQNIVVETTVPLKMIGLETIFRPDVALASAHSSQAYGGFEARFSLDNPVTTEDAKRSICVYGTEANKRIFLLGNNSILCN